MVRCENGPTAQLLRGNIWMSISLFGRADPIDHAACHEHERIEVRNRANFMLDDPPLIVRMKRVWS